MGPTRPTGPPPSNRNPRPPQQANRPPVNSPPGRNNEQRPNGPPRPGPTRQPSRDELRFIPSPPLRDPVPPVSVFLPEEDGKTHHLCSCHLKTEDHHQINLKTISSQCKLNLVKRIPEFHQMIVGDHLKTNLSHFLVNHFLTKTKDQPVDQLVSLVNHPSKVFQLLIPDHRLLPGLQL